MKIGGLQKLTLLDYPSKTACTIFTSGCNFRCPFCQNASLALEENPSREYSREEILSFLNKRQGLLDGVCISGGEPTLQNDLEDFIKEIKALGFAVKLDTNGARPDVLEKLIQNSLVDYVAMDIKNSPEKYARTSGAQHLDKVKQSVELLLQGEIDYEFRTTVVKGLHEKEDFEAIGKWISGCKSYYLQQYRDSEDIISPEGLSSFDAKEMEEFLKITQRYIPQTKLRGL